MMADRLFSA